jgi:hypothetical protein
MRDAQSSVVRVSVRNKMFSAGVQADQEHGPVVWSSKERLSTA